MQEKRNYWMFWSLNSIVFNKSTECKSKRHGLQIRASMGANSRQHGGQHGEDYKSSPAKVTNPVQQSI